jgi:hypothetical protein
MEGSTLESGFDHIEGMDGKCGTCASCEASNGLDQRGGEARMVVVHEGGIGFVML